MSKEKFAEVMTQGEVQESQAWGKVNQDLQFQKLQKTQLYCPGCPVLMLKEESDYGNSDKEILKQSERAMRKQIIDKKRRKLFGNTVLHGNGQAK